MKIHQTMTQRRNVEKHAVETLRVVLAVAVSSLGLTLLLLPPIAEDFERIGLGEGFRHLLGVIHLGGGLALLVPSLARTSAFWLGCFIASVALFLQAEGASIHGAGPVALAFGLLIFGVCLRLRRRDAVSTWHDTLGRYADQQDSRRGN